MHDRLYVMVRKLLPWILYCAVDLHVHCTVCSENKGAQETCVPNVCESMAEWVIFEADIWNIGCVSSRQSFLFQDWISI